MGEGSVFYWHLFHLLTSDLCNRFSFFVCLWFWDRFWILEFGFWKLMRLTENKRRQKRTKRRVWAKTFWSWHAMRYHDWLWWHTIPDPRQHFSVKVSLGHDILGDTPMGHDVRQVKLGDPTLVALVVVGMLLSQKASVVKNFAVHATFS